MSLILLHRTTDYKFNELIKEQSRRAYTVNAEGSGTEEIS